MTPEIEQKLVEQAKTDPQAFGVLYDRHYGRIYGYILRRTGDLETSLDLTAITFLKAWQQLRKGKFIWRGVPFAAWLYRIAGNEVNSYFRRQQHRPLSLDALFEANGLEPAGDYDVEAEAIEWQRQLAIQQTFTLIQSLLQQLPAKYQEVLALRFFEKRSIGQISLITGKKTNTVKSLLRRGTEKLRLAHAAQAAASERDDLQLFSQPGVITSGDSSYEND